MAGVDLGRQAVEDSYETWICQGGVEEMKDCLDGLLHEHQVLCGGREAERKEGRERERGKRLLERDRKTGRRGGEEGSGVYKVTE